MASVLILVLVVAVVQTLLGKVDIVIRYLAVVVVMEPLQVIAAHQ